MHLSYKVKDQMRVEVVRNVDITPKYKSIYLSPIKGNEFKFNITHGSGYFYVHLNNTDIANFTERDGVLTIIPRREGALEIKIEDIELPDSE